MAYAEEVALAQEMITDFGVLVTVRTITPGTYDPVADTDTGAVTSTFTAYGVKLPMLNRPELRDLFAINGTGLLSDHSILLIPALTSAGAALPFVPGPGDLVVFGTYVAGTPSPSWWKIDSLSPLEPDMTPIMYTVLMTKGAGDLLNF